MNKPDHPDAAALRKYMETFKNSDDLDLLCHMSGWKEDYPKHRAIALELQRRAKRREQRVAWVAIGVSVASLCVATAALIVRIAV